MKEENHETWNIIYLETYEKFCQTIWWNEKDDCLKNIEVDELKSSEAESDKWFYWRQNELLHCALYTFQVPFELSYIFWMTFEKSLS